MVNSVVVNGQSLKWFNYDSICRTKVEIKGRKKLPKKSMKSSAGVILSVDCLHNKKLFNFPLWLRSLSLDFSLYTRGHGELRTVVRGEMRISAEGDGWLNEKDENVGRRDGLNDGKCENFCVWRRKTRKIDRMMMRRSFMFFRVSFWAFSMFCVGKCGKSFIADQDFHLNFLIWYKISS